jgi:hypothetical protein
MRPSPVERGNFANEGGASAALANRVAAQCAGNRAANGGPRFALAVRVREQMGRGLVAGRLKAMARGACALLGLAAWSTACGGKYEDPNSHGPDEPTTSSAGSSSSSSSNTGSSSSLPTHPLGVCVPGFDRSSNPSRPCEWISQKGECFDSFDAACACVCPTSGNSVCSGGFSNGANSATTVYCDPA